MTAATDPRWTLRRRLSTSTALIALLLTLLSAVVTVAVISFVSAGNRVIYRWQAAELTSERVLADLVNEETGLRGYALGHSPRFLQPYNQYLQRQRADDARLHVLIGGDTALHLLLRRVEESASTWHASIAVPLVDLVRGGGSPTAAQLDAGKSAFDAIRLASGRMSAAVIRHAGEARAARTRAGIFAGTAAAVAVLIVIASALLVRRGLMRWVLGPVDRLRAQTREVASGATQHRIVTDGPAELVELGDDVEAMRVQIFGQLRHAENAREELRLRSAELARSNEDLQQFAYVASHDLSEPLRKVANFCQLLERQYAPQLDDRARQYIDFAVDGAKRMQVLITDLLALSRVARSTEEFVEVDLDTGLDRALLNLADRIAEAGGRIERESPLPTVQGDQALLVSLLENLVGNAIKYRRPGVPPVLCIRAERDPELPRWIITVSDNGIGIDQQYNERIFAVFQRLHLREQYDGTGIGLALCRRIVEFHGGRIWLADLDQGDRGDQGEQGATFRFTLPDSGADASSRGTPQAGR